MGARRRKSNTALVGNVGEYLFCAESSSRGCVPYLPIGSAKGIDVILLTPTGRRVTVQVKAQGTDQLHTVDLCTNIMADVLAVCHLGDWYLMPGSEVKGRTVNILQVKKWNGNWSLIK